MFDATRLTELRRVSDAALSPDETWLAVAVSRLADDESAYVSDLWRVETTGNAPPRQLTRGESSDGSPCFRRDGGLGFLSARGDDSPTRAQVWLLPAGGGEARALTEEPLGVLSFRFARDAAVLVALAPQLPAVAHADQRERAAQRETRGESGLLYTTNQVRHWDHWMADEAPRFLAYDDDGGSRRPLTPDALHEFRDFEFGLGWDLSSGGETIVSESRHLADDRLQDCALVLINTRSGEQRDLARAPKHWYTTPRFATGSDDVVALSEPRPEGTWHRPRIVLCRSGSEPRVLDDGSDAVPSAPMFTFDGARVVFSGALAGHQPVFTASVDGGGVERITAAASGGSHQSLAVGNDTVFGVRHGLLAPPEPFAAALTADAEPRLLTSLSGIETGETGFATVSMQTSIAADGTEVPWFLVQPSADAAPAPAQLWIHGGPISQWSDGWHWRWNPLVAVAAGYACALPNPRGSTGLGPAFTHEIWNNRWGAECFTDLMTVTDDLEARGDIDETRVAALGGSFGGYMANWIGTQTDRFRCLVSHAGIYHFPAFYGTTDHPPYWRLQMASDPYSAPEAFVTHSPHRFIDNWKTPVLVIHGERDYRVPISEALLLFDALRDRAIDAELLVFPNENHWILRPHNARRWYSEILRFIGERMPRPNNADSAQ